METFVVVLQDETVKVKADSFIEISEGFRFYIGEEEVVAWFRAETVQRIYKE